MIRQEGGLVPADWDTAIRAVLSHLRGAENLAGLLSGRNTNEEAYLFAKLMKKLSPQSALEVVYQERELSEVAKILMSPDRSPNFRGAHEMGVGSDDGFDSWLQDLIAGRFSSAYVVGEDLAKLSGDGDQVEKALGRLSFLVVQDTQLTPTARLAHVVLPATHFAEKEGTYTNRKGRVQKLNPAVVRPEGARHDWEIFAQLLNEAGEPIACGNPGEIFRQLTAEVPRYRNLTYRTLGEQGYQPENT
jgi:predicted molibdopterin-dependent oxidoreductase YjgC